MRLDCDDDMDDGEGNGPPWWLLVIFAALAVSIASAALAILFALGFAAHSLWAAWL